MLILLPGAAIGVLIGYLLGGRGFRRGRPAGASASISIAFALRRLVIERRRPEIAARQGRLCRRAMFWGLICGFTSMVAHAGGPPFQIYVMPQRLPATVFVGTGAILFAADELDQGAALHRARASSARRISRPPRPCSRWRSPRPMRASGWCGGVSGQRFYTIVYVLLILVGGKLMYDGAAGLL